MSIRAFQEEIGWGDGALVSALIDYIENHQNDEEVMDYLNERLDASLPVCDDPVETKVPPSHKEWREQMVKPEHLLPDDLLEKQDLQPPPPRMQGQEIPIAQQEGAKRDANDMTKDEVTLSAAKAVDCKVVQALLYTLIGYYGNKKVYHPDGASFDVDNLVDTYLRTKEPKGDALAAQLQESSTDSAMHELLEMLPSNDDLFQAYHSFRSQIQERIRSQFPTTKFENF